MKQLITFLIFAFFGVGIEVVFTGLKNIFNQQQSKEIKWSLVGYSSVWMFPIYGSVAFLFPSVYNFVSTWHIILRMSIYAIAIFGIELTTGFILKRVIGKCPWRYESRWSVGGYIRLDYLPYWMIFGLIIEFIYRAL